MSTENKKETWKLIINMIISILTAIATTFGLTSSCQFIMIDRIFYNSQILDKNSEYFIHRIPPLPSVGHGMRVGEFLCDQ